MRRNALLLSTVLLTLVACQDQELPTGLKLDESTPSFAISDAAHGGPAGFFFLPPLVPNPGRFTGSFDASASPEVRICKWSAGACLGGDVATFSLGSTPALELNAADENFHVNWKTKDLGFRAGEVYRIRVYRGATLLGNLDVLITTDAQERKGVGTDYVGLRPGKPLNIKFRIETQPPPVVGTLAFTSSDFEIYTVKADGTALTNLTNLYFTDYLPSWSPDGTKIAFSSNRGTMGGLRADIYVMNADGTNVTRLTNTTARNEYAVWSPDGSKIAFVSTRDGNGEIYVMNVDGTGQARLTNDPGSDSSPAWSPDGMRIAYENGPLGMEWKRDIYVVNADGSGRVRLTNTSPNYSPLWSPDGTRIVFLSSRDDNPEIYVMNADGTGEVNLTNHPDGDHYPAWSPDGTKIAFSSNRWGGYEEEVYVMNADGTGATRLTYTEGWEHLPAWSPDGKKITFIYDPTGVGMDPYELYAMNSDGTGLTKLTNDVVAVYASAPAVWRP